MNEQRLQADYQLIESLLNCPSAEELDWAMTQNNLGAAYRNRIFGERAENIELAIAP